MVRCVTTARNREHTWDIQVEESDALCTDVGRSEVDMLAVTVAFLVAMHQ